MAERGNNSGELGRNKKMKASGWILVIFSASLTVVGNILLRAGVDRAGGFSGQLAEIPSALWRLGRQPIFDGGIVLYLLAMVVWFRILATEPLSTAYPIMMSLNFVLVTLGAVILFRESFSLTKLIGLAIVLSGIFILSRG